MTVAELIARLSTLDQSLPIVARGYEAGYDNVDSVAIIKVKWNGNTKSDGITKDTWFFGIHESAEYKDQDDNIREVVVL